MLQFHSPEINEIFDDANLEAKEISAIFSGNSTIDLDNDFNLKPIISSELDCDRLDYLKRTSHFTGLPYGNVDIDYLISSIQYSDKRISFSAKAKKSIDHMLLARFHDYQQVVFHKRLIPLEWSLKNCIKIAEESSKTELSEEKLIERIKNNDIRSFDDNEIISAIKKIESDFKKRPDVLMFFHIQSVLYGKFATQIFSKQQYIEGGDLKSHSLLKDKIEKCIKDFCQNKNIDEGYICLWSERHKISKAEPSILCDDETEGIENSEELVVIQNSTQDPPMPLIESQDSIIGILARKYLSDIRVFTLPIEKYKTEFDDLSGQLKQLCSLKAKRPCK